MATFTKRNKSWFVQVSRRGFRLSKSFQTKGEATAWAAQVEHEIISGKYKTGSDKTFSDALDRYMDEVTPTKKASENERYLIAAIGKAPFCSVRITDVTPEMVAQFRDTLLKTLKPGSVQRYLGLVSAVFTIAQREWQWVHDNPVRMIKKPQSGPARDRIFSDDEIARILDELGHNGPSSEVQQAIGDAFLFALETAMRAGEIRELEWAWINGNVATLPRTKNGDKRNVPLSKKALAILETRRCFEKPFDLKPHTLSTTFSIKCKKAGVEGATFHDARHTAITRLAKLLQPFDLARMAGHRNMTMTLKYYNESAESIADKLG